jgi:hypothetical protein
MEKFQIFYEIKSRRSTPFVYPDIVMRAVCEDPLTLSRRGREKTYSSSCKAAPVGRGPVSPFADH